MQVLFVQQQPCIRALKYAEGFRNKYPEIILLFAYQGKTLTEFYGHGDELFASWYALEDEPGAGLSEIISNHRIDLIHSHNAPDTLTNTCIDLFGGQIPIVHDIHDLLSARETAYENGFSNERSAGEWQEQERLAIERSDAILTVSDEIVELANGQYQLPLQTHVFPNYVPDRLIPEQIPRKDVSTRSRPLRIVYQGTLSDNSGHYDLASIFHAIADQGIEVHLYSARDMSSYRQLGEGHPYIFYHGHRPPKELLSEITRYDIGWSGLNASKNRRHLDTVLPNKLFEYIACGLPVVSFPHKSLERFLEEHQVGLVVEDLTNLDAALRTPEVEAVTANVLARRFDFTIEANIGKIAEIYRSLIAIP